MQPRQLVVLAVRVVVPALALPKLVARGQHGHTLRKEQRGQEIALLLRAQCIYGLIVCRAFSTAVPRPVMTFPIVVFFLVGIVVLFVVGYQVVEREPGSRGDGIGAGSRLPLVSLIETAAAREPFRQLGQRACRTAARRAHANTVFPVPFRPARLRIAHLIPAHAEVPWCGDSFPL